MNTTINIIQNFGQMNILQGQAQGIAVTNPTDALASLAGLNPDLTFDLPYDVTASYSDPLPIPDDEVTAFDIAQMLSYILDTEGPGASPEEPIARPTDPQLFSIQNDGDSAKIELAGGYVVEVTKDDAQITISDAAGNKLYSNGDPHWFEQAAGEAAQYATDSKRNSTVAFGDYKLTKITTFDENNPNAATYNNGLLLTGSNGEVIEIGKIYDSGSLTVSSAVDENLAFERDMQTEDGNKIWFNPSSDSQVEYKDENGDDFYRYLTETTLE